MKNNDAADNGIMQDIQWQVASKANRFPAAIPAMKAGGVRCSIYDNMLFARSKTTAIQSGDNLKRGVLSFRLKCSQPVVLILLLLLFLQSRIIFVLLSKGD